MALKLTPVLLLVLSLFFPLICAQDIDLNAVCAERDFQLLAHPNDCTSYIVCYRPTPLVLNCPPNYVYHPELFSCVISYPCNNGTTGQRTFQQALCQNKAGKLFIDPENCNQYIDCGQNPPQTKRCATDEFFSIADAKCVKGSRAACAVGEVPQNICEGQTVGATLTHPLLCDDEYITCTATGMEIFQCLPGFIYNAQTSQCVAGKAQKCL